MGTSPPLTPSRVPSTGAVAVPRRYRAGNGDRYDPFRSTPEGASIHSNRPDDVRLGKSRILIDLQKARAAAFQHHFPAPTICLKQPPVLVVVTLASGYSLHNRIHSLTKRMLSCLLILKNVKIGLSAVIDCYYDERWHVQDISVRDRRSCRPIDRRAAPISYLTIRRPSAFQN